MGEGARALCAAIRDGERQFNENASADAFCVRAGFSYRQSMRSSAASPRAMRRTGAKARIFCTGAGKSNGKVSMRERRF